MILPNIKSGRKVQEEPSPALEVFGRLVDSATGSEPQPCFPTNNTAADLKNMKAMSSSFIRHTTIFLAILLGQVNQEFNQQPHFSGAPTHLAIPPLSPSLPSLLDFIDDFSW